MTAEQLFNNHIRLACSCARMRSKRQKLHEWDNIENTALIGLWQASRSFDSNKSACFITYAKRRINGAMLDEERNRTWMRKRRVKSGPEIITINHFGKNDILHQRSPFDVVAEHDQIKSILELEGDPRRREILRLIAVEGYKCVEVAAMLNMGKGMVFKRLLQAKAEIRCRMASKSLCV